mgnify:CR=1 FL=1|jgi:hypothetical protein
MKVGDLVNYQGWKAIIAEVDRRRRDAVVWYSLFFIGEAPDFLRTTDEGLFYPGFQHWQLKVLSEV